MSSITLPNRYCDNIQLIFIEQKDDFFVFKPKDNYVWDYKTIRISDNGEIHSIDPIGGPCLSIGDYIQGFIIDHFLDDKIYMKKKTSYKIIGISDLHGHLLNNIEECDILCITGDIMPLNIQNSYTKSFNWLINDFFEWINYINCKKVFLIAGNHDFLLEQLNTKAINKIIYEKSLANKLTYLNNCSYKYNDLIFYGCPQIENLKNWAFYTKDGIEFENIPQCDILLTHSAPDIHNLGTTLNYNNYGSKKLANIVNSHNIKLWFCGHIHDGNHNLVQINNTQIYNASILNDDYNVKYPPQIVTLNI